VRSSTPTNGLIRLVKRLFQGRILFKTFKSFKQFKTFTRDKDSLGKSIHELPKPLLSRLRNGLSIADQEGLEVQNEQSTHAFVEAGWIVNYFFRQKLAAPGRIADHRIADEQE
jgi:hypothetical protein